MPESPPGLQQTDTPHDETSASAGSSVDSMTGQLSQRLEALRSEMTSALETAGNEAVAEVLQAVAAVDGAKTQSEILQALVEGAARFASRAAFFLTRPDKVRGWTGDGFDRGTVIDGLELGYEAPWSALAQGTGAFRLNAAQCAALAAQIECTAASEGVLIPFVLRGQLGGALYADRLSGDRPLGVSSLLLLTHAGSQALETAAFRTAPSPALRLRESEAAGAAPGLRFWQEEEAPPARSEPGTEGAAEPEPPAPAAPALETPAQEAEAPPLEEPAEEAVEPEPAPAPEVHDELPAPELEEPAFDFDAAQETPERPSEEAREPAAEEAEEPAIDLGFETAEEPEPLAEELAAEPEPELEDSSADIWALEEEDEEDATVVASPAAEPDRPDAGAVPPVPSVGQETVRLDVAALQGQPPAEAPPEQGFEPPAEEPPPPEVEYELEPVEEDTAVGEAAPETGAEPEAPAAEPGAIEGEEPTLITRQPLAAASPPAAPEVDEAPAAAGYVPPAPAPEGAGTSTEVQPPADLQGPGLAFTQTSNRVDEIAANEEALHEEARRLARLLVSEIKLYNEEIIEEGRRNGDIYERLKDDIDRSRQMYDERIDPRLHGKEDYFRQELVQRLAGGDESLLGM